MITRDQISGLILTGGQGRRLQPTSGPVIEKGLLELGGQPLVARMNNYMQPIVTDVWISANRQVQTYAQYGRVVVDDPDLGEFQGPLAGIASVLPHVRTPWLFVMPVDIPYPPTGLLDVLLQYANKGLEKVYYVHAQREHPLCMLMHVDLGSDLREYLRNGYRKVQDWQRNNAAMTVAYQGDLHDFLNINTPEDLCLATQLNPIVPT
ncbi:MAG: molybdenum cofactor guanylyltransferase [Burkholderiaceae bacterium]|nr:molybdenum cofactor guanylyltransferase [Burkholderiaceae bacterium]